MAIGPQRRAKREAGCCRAAGLAPTLTAKIDPVLVGALGVVAAAGAARPDARLSGLAGCGRVVLLGHGACRLNEVADRIFAPYLIVADAGDPPLPERPRDGSLLGVVLLILVAHSPEFSAQVLVLLDRHLGEPLDLCQRWIRGWRPGDIGAVRGNLAVDREDEAGPEVWANELPRSSPSRPVSPTSLSRTPAFAASRPRPGSSRSPITWAAGSKHPSAAHVTPSSRRWSGTSAGRSLRVLENPGRTSGRRY